MTITRATKETAISVGQWVLGPSALEYGLHSEPRYITRIAGKRIHYKRLDGRESFMMRSAVLIVCDTEAEAKVIHQLSNERHEKVAGQVDHVIQTIGRWCDARLASLVVVA
jgi:hypothetical protein